MPMYRNYLSIHKKIEKKVSKKICSTNKAHEKIQKVIQNCNIMAQQQPNITKNIVKLGLFEVSKTVVTPVH